MSHYIKEMLKFHIKPAYVPIDHQIGIIQRLVWGVLILTILGESVTLLLSQDSKMTLLISTVSILLVSISIISLVLLHLKHIIFSTILMSTGLHAAIIAVIIPRGVTRSAIIMIVFIIPFILLSHLWGRFGATVSVILTIISYGILSSLESLGLTGWSKQENFLWVDIGLQLAILSFIAIVILQSQASIISANQHLLTIQQQLHSFTAGIAHDFGTSIQILYAQVDHIDGRTQQVVQDQLDLMSAFIEQTRTFLAVQNGEGLQLRQDAVSIISVAASAMAAAASSQALHRDIHFELDCPAPLPSQFVRGDATAMRRIIDNLLKNALGVANPGSTIIVRIQQVGQYLELAVIDEGPGIAIEDQEHVFEPYWSSSNGARHTGTGWGIGLAVVRQLVLAMGGECGLISIPETGSTFWIRLKQCEPSS